MHTTYYFINEKNKPVWNIHIRNVILHLVFPLKSLQFSSFSFCKKNDLFFNKNEGKLKFKKSNAILLYLH